MDLSWRTLSDGVWYTVAQPESANVTLIAGKEQALLVDTGGSTEVGAAVLASAQRLIDVEISQVVITHHHYDHWNGLAGMPGLHSIGHENLVTDTTPEELIPTTQFSLVHALDLGDCFVEIAHFGPAHTRSDVVVIVPSKDLIVVGDLLEDEPQLDETSMLSKWPSVLDSALGSANSQTIFLPGHGAPANREAAMLCGGKLGFLYSTVEQLVATGTPSEELYDAVDQWPFSEKTIRAALPHIVAELSAAGVVARKHLPLI